MGIVRLTVFTVLVASAALSTGCKSWSTITAQSPGNPPVEVMGTQLSQVRELSQAYWLIPEVGASTDLRERTDAPLLGWTTNSMLVVVADDPLALTKRKMGRSDASEDILAPLGCDSRIRAWILPPLPSDATLTPSADSPLALQIDVRSVITRPFIARHGKSVSGEPLPTTRTQLAALLDRVAIPVEGTIEIRRPTETETQAEFIGMAKDTPLHLAIASAHGSRFDPQTAARSVLILPFLPIFVISAASGSGAP